MRHKKHRFQLGRFSSFRKATIKELARAIFINHKIVTTHKKAKAVQPTIEKIITIAKRNDLVARREVYDILGDHSLVKKIFDKIAPIFAKRNSGFTRVMLWEKRRGDNAQLAILEFSEAIIEKRQKKVKEAKKVEEKQAQESQTKEEKPPVEEKKKFLGGFKTLFKKEKPV